MPSLSTWSPVLLRRQIGLFKLYSYLALARHGTRDLSNQACFLFSCVLHSITKVLYQLFSKIVVFMSPYKAAIARVSGICGPPAGPRRGSKTCRSWGQMPASTLHNKYGVQRLIPTPHVPDWNTCPCHVARSMQYAASTSDQAHLEP